MRKVMTSVHEAARDVVRRLRGTPDYRQSRRDRKKVEMLFAHLKRILKLDRLRLRGCFGAHDEFTLAAAVQNLRKPEKPATSGAAGCMTKPVKTCSSGANSAGGGKPNGIINTQGRLRILPLRGFSTEFANTSHSVGASHQRRHMAR
jgi:hypothetical protein